MARPCLYNFRIVDWHRFSHTPTPLLSNPMHLLRFVSLQVPHVRWPHRPNYKQLGPRLKERNLPSTHENRTPRSTLLLTPFDTIDRFENQRTADDIAHGRGNVEHIFKRETSYPCYLAPGQPETFEGNGTDAECEMFGFG